MSRQKSNPRQPRVLVSGEVLRQVRQHARSNSKTEVCGVLIGNENGNTTEIDACIAGVNAAQAGTHVTFTQDTWEHIYKTKDKEYPEHRIVGWYHSHPGFGVFLSDHDTFIHENFFSSKMQLAWVYDPHSDEEGCFGWSGDRIERLSEISVTDTKGGERAGETGKPEPVGAADDDGDDGRVVSVSREETESPAWLRWTATILSYLLTVVVGFLISWLLFPRLVPVPLIFDRDTSKFYRIDPRELQRYLESHPNSQPADLPPFQPDVPAAPNAAPNSNKDKNVPR